jgi:hypothetical protein
VEHGWKYTEVKEDQDREKQRVLLDLGGKFYEFRPGMGMWVQNKVTAWRWGK